MLYPVLISNVKVSKKTSRITNCSTLEELLKKEETLFKGKSDAELMIILEDIYNNKLANAQRQEILGYDTEQKRQHAINALSYQLELVQEMPRVTSSDAPVNQVGFFLRNRLNVSNQVSRKTFWQTTTHEVVKAYGFKKDADFSAVMQSNGQFVYLYRENSFTPEVNAEGKVITTPKRAGAGGDLLLKDGKLIFQRTFLVMQAFESLEEYTEKTEALEAKEQANVAEFKHDSVIDVVNNVIPTEVRLEDGTFNQEFQAWLHEFLGKSVGMQIEVAA